MSDVVIEMPETFIRRETAPFETVTYTVWMDGQTEHRVRSDSWDFIRGMEAASSTHPDDRIRVNLLTDDRTDSVQLLTDKDPEFYNHYKLYGDVMATIPKQYELGPYLFDSMEFLDGYQFYCRLVGVQVDLDMRQLVMVGPISMEVEV